MCLQRGNLPPPQHCYRRYWLQPIQWHAQEQTQRRHQRFYVEQRKDMIRQCPDLKLETLVVGFGNYFYMDLLIVEIVWNNTKGMAEDSVLWVQVATAMQLLELHDTLSAETVQIFLRKKIQQKLWLGFKATCSMLGMLGADFALKSCADYCWIASVVGSWTIWLLGSLIVETLVSRQRLTNPTQTSKSIVTEIRDTLLQSYISNPAQVVARLLQVSHPNPLPRPGCYCGAESFDQFGFHGRRGRTDFPYCKVEYQSTAACRGATKWHSCAEKRLISGVCAFKVEKRQKEQCAKIVTNHRKAPQEQLVSLSLRPCIRFLAASAGSGVSAWTGTKWCSRGLTVKFWACCLGRIHPQPMLLHY